jgi:hypothetical protein
VACAQAHGYVTGQQSAPRTSMLRSCRP